ncbi:hypothetical protein [Novosphingobium pentaromativorans]|uniref:Uncharacterized protein n=1 Tax=Novosphingobium pentaromativorans US6-1 TaxID=1088721 RepID=G6EFG4_9SPHN|nr:hypothetical protein [Novosphingobium pentaromativorans]EHJ60009.1 hypothetical protein NSU_3085 [Novosphingobium pentaromativorans US6-1]
MPKSPIHPNHCRCQRCAPRHPASNDRAPSPWALLIAIGALVLASVALRDCLSTWSSF